MDSYTTLDNISGSLHGVFYGIAGNGVLFVEVIDLLTSEDLGGCSAMTYAEQNDCGCHVDRTLEKWLPDNPRAE